MPGPDINAYVQSNALFDKSKVPAGNWIGTAITRYDVAKIQDVRNQVMSPDSHGNLQAPGPCPAYHVRCTVRLRLYNTATFSLPHGTLTDWEDYPTVLINSVLPSVPTGARVLVEFSLIDYTPKTVNASVNTDHTDLAVSGKASTRQHTVGSASTVTNNFGVNLNVGPEGGETGPSAGVH